MGGGRLKIDYLNAGAVVKAFSVMDATSLRRARRQPQRAGLLVRQAPRRLAVRHRPRATAPTPASSWAGSITAAARRSIDELTQNILKLNVVGFYVFAMPTQPLGWFKKELKGPDDFKGMKYRTVGLASNVMQAMGASVAQLPGRKSCRRWKRA